MEAVIKAHPGKGFEYSVDFPEPEIGPGDALIKISAASICGSDRELFEWTPMAQAMGPRLPLVVGHECSGVVAGVGNGVRDLKVGQRVALESHIFCGGCGRCRRGDGHMCDHLGVLGFTHDGGFAEYACVPCLTCVCLPDGISDEAGALLEPFGVAVHAMQRASLGAIGGATVLVNGCGPIGLFVIELAWLFGASVVVGLEPNPYRRGLAEERGALTIDPTAGDPGGRCSELALRRGGFDIAFEVSGVDGMVPFLLKMLRPEGMAVTVGHPSSATAIDIAQYINKRGVILKGVFGRRIWGSWELALDIILSGRIDPCRVVTHRLGLSDAEEAIDLLRTGAGKVILKPKSVSA